jgi:hypothetical protein
LVGLAGALLGFAAGLSTFLAGVVAFFTVAFVLAILFIVLILPIYVHYHHGNSFLSLEKNYAYVMYVVFLQKNSYLTKFFSQCATYLLAEIRAVIYLYGRKKQNCNQKFCLYILHLSGNKNTLFYCRNEWCRMGTRIRSRVRLIKTKQ